MQEQVDGTNNIIPSVEGDFEDEGPAPKTLRELGIERILGRKIIRWTSNLGSYGMGGAGFFGLRLTQTTEFAEEWLVLTLWGASNWLLLDGQWVEATPNQYHIQRPLYSNFFGMAVWDEISDTISGGVIIDVLITENASTMHIRNGNKTHQLEIPENTLRLPRYGGTLEERIWYPHESQLDAWVLSESGQLWV